MEPIVYKYTSTKEYHDSFPCAYRQWRADSHCNQIHGYSFTIKVYFGADTLDARNWCADYGGLKDLKAILEDQFDHTLIVAHDDPHLPFFQEMNNLVTVRSDNDVESTVPQERGAVCDIRVVHGVGCEKFAELAYNTMQDILETYQRGESYALPNGKTFSCRYPVGQGVKLRSAEVFEHSANSAVYEG